VDGDGPVIDIGAVEFQPTNVIITAKGSPSSVSPGGTITYTLTVITGKGGDNAAVANLTLTDAVPAQTTFQSFTTPIGWIVTAPPVGGTGQITATFASLGHNATPSFTLVVTVARTPTGSTITNTATIATTSPQPTSGGKIATVKTTLTPGNSEAALVGPPFLTSPAASSSTDPSLAKAPAVQEMGLVTAGAETSLPVWARRSLAALGRRLHLPRDFWSELD
jgi:uncharacterized repeat protein (TIGR01451 family)